MESTVKLEEEAPVSFELSGRSRLLEPTPHSPVPASIIDLSSSGSDSDAEPLKRRRSSDDIGGTTKRRKSVVKMLASLPPGFLDPLPVSGEKSMRPLPVTHTLVAGSPQRSRQFWKAGDFDGLPVVDDSVQFSLGMDHVRVHPKFLHSNATSHKWVLGAFAELLDNSLDEICNGATYVNIDVLENKKDGTKMLHIEDNGGGMDPDKMRQCMSLGYSTKSKIANCIGQYGNGFKTSTMRLGADVIVFSRSHGNGKSPTKSIGMLSYTFLKNTGKEDIVVPMLNYEMIGQHWEKLTSSAIDWNKNVDIIAHWSPYSCEAELLQQFDLMPNHGTLIVIYNLWEDDLGKLELDFETNIHDIQISGVNRDEKKIQMSKEFPNSKHFLTYRHSLRSYASILYLRLPNAFKMVLRGKEIEHHNIVNDMMLKQEVTYRPNPGTDVFPKDPNLVAVVTIGFVKDAKHHIDVQGFNVYHKNRLIKPFWRVWNAAGSDGRGVIGVLEANFVEPAHDKQGFERTTVLSRLETRLVLMQKTYWSKNCHKVGYAPRSNIKYIESKDDESSPEVGHLQLYQHPKRGVFTNKASKDSSVSKKGKGVSATESSRVGKRAFSKQNGTKGSNKHMDSKGSHLRTHKFFNERDVIDSESDSKNENCCIEGDKSVSSAFPSITFSNKASSSELFTASPCSLKSSGATVGIATRSQAKAASAMLKERAPSPEAASALLKKGALAPEATSALLKKGGLSPEVYQLMIKQLEDENKALKQSVKTTQESILLELELERSEKKSLADQLEEKQKKLDEANKEQEALIDIFSEERSRRDEEEATLRKRLKEAQDEIHDLLGKLATYTR